MCLCAEEKAHFTGVVLSCAFCVCLHQTKPMTTVKMHRRSWTSLRLLPYFQCHRTCAALSLPTANGNFAIWRKGRNSNASVFHLETKLQGFLGFSKFLKAQVKNIFIFLKDRNAANPALSHKKNYTCLIIHAAAAELHASQGQTATQVWILFFIPSILLFLSPLLFYSHVASR